MNSKLGNRVKKLGPQNANKQPQDYSSPTPKFEVFIIFYFYKIEYINFVLEFSDP